MNLLSACSSFSVFIFSSPSLPSFAAIATVHCFRCVCLFDTTTLAFLYMSRPSLARPSNLMGLLARGFGAVANSERKSLNRCGSHKPPRRDALHTSRRRPHCASTRSRDSDGRGSGGCFGVTGGSCGIGATWCSAGETSGLLQCQIELDWRRSAWAESGRYQTTLLVSFGVYIVASFTTRRASTTRPNSHQHFVHNSVADIQRNISRQT